VAEDRAEGIAGRTYRRGRSVIHVLDDGNPGDGFSAVAPDLEDVYFGELRHAASTEATISRAA
jgi:hypothetical protein